MRYAMPARQRRLFVLRRAASEGRGFTLLEMIIVIGVILLLTLVTVTVIAGMSRRGEIRDTENTMRLMEQAVSEWELAMGRSVTYGIEGEPCDNDERYELRQLLNAGAIANEPDSLRESDMLWAHLNRASVSREIITRMNPDFMIELDPNAAQNNVPNHFGVNNLDHLTDFADGRLSYRFLDAWGNPIVAVMPGRRSNAACDATSYCHGMTPVNGHCPDDDGTIRTPLENRVGVAANRRVFFVSAGPSGRFGDLQLNISRTSGSFNAAEAALADDNIYSHDIIIEEGRPQ